KAQVAGCAAACAGVAQAIHREGRKQRASFERFDDQRSAPARAARSGRSDAQFIDRTQVGRFSIDAKHGVISFDWRSPVEAGNPPENGSVRKPRIVVFPRGSLGSKKGLTSDLASSSITLSAVASRLRLKQSAVSWTVVRFRTFSRPRIDDRSLSVYFF